MKKIIYIVSVLLITFMSACDELPDEQFDKKVNLIKNGWVDMNLEILADNIIEIPVNISVSGTSKNEKTVEVVLDTISKLLSDYNFEKYRNETELYYNLVPAEALSFSKDVVIPAGEEQVNTIVKVDLNKLTNRYGDYVLPIGIKSTSEYSVGNSNYSTGLYHIVLTNRFSGNYGADIAVMKLRPNGASILTDKTSVANKSLYAISNNECFFYAGQYNRNSLGRDKFIVKLKIDNEEISLSGVNPDLGLEITALDSIPKVSYTIERNREDNRYVTLTTKIDLSYVFMDLGLEKPEKRRAAGLMSNSRSVLKEQ
ncbi:DUF4361 domain-containing protein [Bacteroidales bacterium OttesenSCG-928-I14]|nr:DUF4361 domain-containing protein [Bacteroidales bacterium OttesenSCG-928-I14]